MALSKVDDAVVPDDPFHVALFLTRGLLKLVDLAALVYRVWRIVLVGLTGLVGSVRALRIIHFYGDNPRFSVSLMIQKEPVFLIICRTQHVREKTINIRRGNFCTLIRQDHVPSNYH